MGVGQRLPQYKACWKLCVVGEGEPTMRDAAAVREAGRSNADPNPLNTTEWKERVVVPIIPAPQRAMGDDPRTIGRGKTRVGSPVGAYLVDAGVVGVGGQATGDLLHQVGDKRGPAATAGHRRLSRLLEIIEV